MRIERTHDMGLIEAVLSHPAIYPCVTDDSSPPVEDFVPIDNPSFYRLAAYEDDEVVGVFLFHPENFICYRGHFCILPKYWGIVTDSATKAALRWMFDNAPCLKITGHIPAYNLAACRASSRAGMRVEGRSIRSVMKGGILHDQILFGIEKGK